MEHKPFLSVIMPVYGVAPYLRQAITSVLDQTFQDFEIILVNDCSPDNSAVICEEFSQRYDNVKTITHAENKGLSAARNTGFAQARGEYVWFMDSDDYVEPDLLEKAYTSLQKNKAEVVVFGCVEDYYNQKGDCTKTVAMCPAEAYCETAEAVHKQVLKLEKGTFYGYAWNKFYLADRIREHELQYENIVLIEDILFNVKFFNHISTMNVLPITPYHYAKRGTTSLTAKFVPDYYILHKQRVQLLYDQQEQWHILDEQAKNTLANIYIRYIFSALSRNCDKRAKMTHRSRKEFLNGVFEDTLFKSLIDFSTPSSMLLKCMSFVLKRRSVFAALFVGRVIFVVQNKLQPLFVFFKQVRK